MQVIWAIGASMMVLSGSRGWDAGPASCSAWRSSPGTISSTAFWPASNLLDQQWPLWVALHSQMAVRAGPFLFVFVYPLLPWIGVMLLGFGVAGVFELPPGRRNALLLRAGVALTAAFVLLRAARRLRRSESVAAPAGRN